MKREEIRKIENQINNMLMDEEVYWKQRSRANSLREGVKIPNFFSFQSFCLEEEE